MYSKTALCYLKVVTLCFGGIRPISTYNLPYFDLLKLLSSTNYPTVLTADSFDCINLSNNVDLLLTSSGVIVVAPTR